MSVIAYLLVCVFCFPLSAQQLNYTLNRDYLYSLDNYFNDKDQSFQTFVKPYRTVDLKEGKDSTVVFPVLSEMYDQLMKPTKQYWENSNVKIKITPLLVSQIGLQATSPFRIINDLAIGGNVEGNIGNRFSFNIKALAGKAVFNSYIDSVIDEVNVVPGIGYAYRDNNDSINQSYAYQYYSGYLSYSPNKVFNFQLGQGKHFWGDGYRSLYLSDVPAPYPYFKITTNIWKLNYVNLYTVMSDPMTNPTGLKKDWLVKYGTFHYLGLNLSKRINIGFYESVIFQGTDSTRYRGYDINYLNPIIFFRPVEYSGGSSDNSSLGLSFKIKCFKKQQVYGQLYLDDFSLKEALERSGFWQNKFAYQVGLKSFDLFKVKKLNFQAEFNYIKPYTYSHGTAQQSYSQLNQPLAHPLGANFMEAVSFINYRKNRVFIEGKVVYAIYGADSLGTDYGKNIFISYKQHPNDYGNFVGQGLKTNLITTSLRAAYILDSEMNLKIELGVSYRVEQTAIYSKNTPLFFIGLKTDLGNLYDDF